MVVPMNESASYLVLSMNDTRTIILKHEECLLVLHLRANSETCFIQDEHVEQRCEPSIYWGGRVFSHPQIFCFKNVFA